MRRRNWCWSLSVAVAFCALFEVAADAPAEEEIQPKTGPALNAARDDLENSVGLRLSGPASSQDEADGGVSETLSYPVLRRPTNTVTLYGSRRYGPLYEPGRSPPPPDPHTGWPVDGISFASYPVGVDAVGGYGWPYYGNAFRSFYRPWYVPYGYGYRWGYRYPFGYPRFGYGYGGFYRPWYTYNLYRPWYTYAPYVPWYSHRLYQPWYGDEYGWGDSFDAPIVDITSDDYGGCFYW